MKKLVLVRQPMKKSLLFFAFFLVVPVGSANSAVFDIDPGDIAGLINAINTAKFQRRRQYDQFGGGDLFFDRDRQRRNGSPWIQ